VTVLVKDSTIGFIGLGLMGKPMSLNLHRAGAKLVVHNRSQAVVQELTRAGMASASSPRAVAQRTTVIIVMLSDTPAVESVLLGTNGVMEGIQSGSLVIDMGTTAVMATRDFAREVYKAGCGYVDAPVSGGQIGAIEGKLTIMAGGTGGAFERARPLLEVLGAHVTHVGAVGAGQVAKAANQIIVGLTIGAVAEAVALTQACGVDAAKMREALRGGFAWSRIMELHGQRMIDDAFQPGGKASTQRKDLQQALELARQVGVKLPATELGRGLYDQLIEQGGGDLDHSALIKVLR
jgi:3-hydroxyisobutyrate dehydrogenase-like beta-hydroxyacid dehydrogenase